MEPASGELLETLGCEMDYALKQVSHSSTYPWGHIAARQLRQVGSHFPV